MASKSKTPQEKIKAKIKRIRTKISKLKTKIKEMRSDISKAKAGMESIWSENADAIKEQRRANGDNITLADIRSQLNEDDAYAMGADGTFSDDASYYHDDFRLVLRESGMIRTAKELSTQVGVSYQTFIREFNKDVLANINGDSVTRDDYNNYKQTLEDRKHDLAEYREDLNEAKDQLARLKDML